MPAVRKAAEEEFRTVGVRAAIEREYDGYLADFGPGDYGCVELDLADPTKQTVRNRLAGAADRRGLVIRFIKTRGDTIRFKIEDEGIEDVLFWPTQRIEEAAPS